MRTVPVWKSASVGNRRCSKSEYAIKLDEAPASSGDDQTSVVYAGPVHATEITTETGPNWTD